MTAISAKRDQMRMIVGKIGMLMRDVGRIVVWPESPGQANTGKTDQRHRPKGRIHADPCAHLPGQRIADQPAGVRQGELRGKDRRPVFGMGRAAQQPARGCLRRRIAKAQDQPQRQHPQATPASRSASPARAQPARTVTAPRRKRNTAIIAATTSTRAAGSNVRQTGRSRSRPLSLIHI